MIHIVIGMNWLLRPNHAAGKLDRTIGDHLVGVHVGLRPGTSLEYDQRKLVIPTAVDHFLRGANDQIDLFLRKLGQFAVRQGGTLLRMPSARMTGRPQRKRSTPIGKLMLRALRLCTPQVIGRNQDVS